MSYFIVQEFNQHFNNAVTLEEVGPSFGLGAESVQEAHRKFKHSESKKALTCESG